MARVDADGMYTPEIVDLDGHTIVFDRQRGLQVMRIKGLVVLPIGAEVELVDPNVNAVVKGVRLLAAAGTSPACVCLDVEVPETYWNHG
jgi:hypothetical protein